jgi:hypothetical protein
VPIVLQNFQNGLRSISRELTKRAAIADRSRLQAIAEVACQFIADYVVPQIIIQSPRIRPGKLVLVDAKRLLQHGVIPGSSQTRARESALQAGMGPALGGLATMESGNGILCRT